jgi:hypothetical protein
VASIRNCALEELERLVMRRACCGNAQVHCDRQRIA